MVVSNEIPEVYAQHQTSMSPLASCIWHRHWPSDPFMCDMYVYVMCTYCGPVSLQKVGQPDSWTLIQEQKRHLIVCLQTQLSPIMTLELPIWRDKIKQAVIDWCYSFVNSSVFVVERTERHDMTWQSMWPEEKDWRAIPVFRLFFSSEMFAFASFIWMVGKTNITLQAEIFWPTVVIFHKILHTLTTKKMTNYIYFCKNRLCCWVKFHPVVLVCQEEYQSLCRLSKQEF